jgi:glycosyltransferase involved in cell wall biosynthesis
VTEYASKIAELLDSPARREQMGRLGRDRVQRYLTWDHSTVRLLAAYRQALGLQAATSVGVPAAPLAAPRT